MGEPRYREYPIRRVLASFIKCIWSLESDGPVYTLPERILPDGCVELVFHFQIATRKQETAIFRLFAEQPPGDQDRQRAQ